MTSDVAYNKIETNAYNNVFEIMNTRSNIADPRNRPTTVAFVYTFDPLMKGLGFSGLPYMILELPTIESSRESVDSKFHFVKWKHKITIRTARDGSGNSRVDVGVSDIQAIGDALFTTFWSHQVKQQLRYLGQQMVEIRKTGNDLITLDQKMIFEAVYELTYETRTKVDPD